MQPIPTYAHIGQAVSDLVLNGERPTALLVRTYVQRILRDSQRAPPAHTPSDPAMHMAPEDEFIRAGRAIDEARARAKAASSG